MKRPEGFDPVPAAKPKQAAAVSSASGLSRLRKAKGADANPAPAKSTPATAAPVEPTRSKPARWMRARLNQAGLKQPAPKQAAPKQVQATQAPSKTKAAETRPQPPQPYAKNSGRGWARRHDSSREARQAARQRRRYERDEVRRFTRRARHRRFAWITAASVVVALVGAVAIAVFSPILALAKIEVTGTSAVSADDVIDAVDGQVGTPLALVDSDRLKRELSDFTLIQSYVTETVPPGTLIIHITERKPIGSIPTASGFTVVDPAGVVIEKTDTRPAGIPTIELAGGDTDSDVFDSVVEVLLTLPASVAAQVDRVTAATKDDVTLVLTGAGQRVVWGSAGQSDLKARVLAALMATQDPGARIEYDVTAPLSAVIRTQ